MAHNFAQSPSSEDQTTGTPLTCIRTWIYMEINKGFCSIETV